MQVWKRRSEHRDHLLAAIARAATIGVLALGAPAGSSRALLVVESCPDGGDDCSPDGDETLRQGLVALWHFDDEVGSAMAADASGNNNHGRLVDLDPATAWVAGRSGRALNVAGGYVEVRMSPSIGTITNGVTIAAWISLDGPIVSEIFGTAISRQIGGSVDQYYHLSVNDKELPTVLITPNSLPRQFAALHNSSPVTRSTFIHVAGTYDGSQARLYVDGAAKSSVDVTGTFLADTTPVILGANGNEAQVTERFPGRIDEIALYSRALEPQEIARLAEGALFSFRAPPTN
jgi:hypothetical protein